MMAFLTHYFFLKHMSSFLCRSTSAAKCNAIGMHIVLIRSLRFAAAELFCRDFSPALFQSSLSDPEITQRACLIFSRYSLSTDSLAAIGMASRTPNSSQSSHGTFVSSSILLPLLLYFCGFLSEPNLLLAIGELMHTNSLNLPTIFAW